MVQNDEMTWEADTRLVDDAWRSMKLVGAEGVEQEAEEIAIVRGGRPRLDGAEGGAETWNWRMSQTVADPLQSRSDGDDNRADADGPGADDPGASGW